MEEWDSSVKDLLKGVAKAAHYIGHTCAPSIESNIASIIVAVDFIEQWKVLKQMGSDAASRVEADSKGALVGVLLLQASKFANLSNTGSRADSEALVPKNPGQEDITALTNLNVCPVIEKVLQHDEFLACVRVKAEGVIEQLGEAVTALTDSTEGMHIGGSNLWKADIPEDASLDDVLKAAKASLDSIDGDKAENCHRAVTEASSVQGAM